MLEAGELFGESGAHESTCRKCRRAAAPRVVKLLTFSKSGSHRAQIKKVTILGNQRLTTGGLVKRAKNRPTSTKRRQQD